MGGLTEDISNIEVIKTILKILEKDENCLKFVKDRPGHDRKYAIDWAKIKKQLRWEPLHDFYTWLEKTCRWYKENRNWWEKLKVGTYQKYYQKQYSDL